MTSFWGSGFLAWLFFNRDLSLVLLTVSSKAIFDPGVILRHFRFCLAAKSIFSYACHRESSRVLFVVVRYFWFRDHRSLFLVLLLIVNQSWSRWCSQVKFSLGNRGSLLVIVSRICLECSLYSTAIARFLSSILSSKAILDLPGIPDPSLVPLVIRTFFGSYS